MHMRNGSVYGVIEEDEPRHDFYPADEYNGQMDGWVYKLGQAGMGYYLDGVVEAPALELHKLIWPTDGLVPVELNLDRMLDIKARVGDPATATTEDEKVRKRTAQKQRKKKARDKQGIDLVSQYVDGLMVDAADVSHREKGWWAFDTVNPNAMGGAETYLEQSSADFVASQETRVDDDKEIKEKEQSLEGRGWTTSIQKCNKGDGGGKSSGTAVSCRNHIGMAESIADGDLPAALAGRFRVRHIGAMCKGGFHFASGYLRCTVGLKHVSNLDYLQAVAGVLKSLRGPWVFAADFQNTPEQLRESGWLELVGGKIVAPTLPTCHKRTIDYFVVSKDLAGAVMGVLPVGDASCKPHKPVRMYIRARPRTMTIRTLKSIGTFEAVLPHGPPKKPQYMAGRKSC